MFGKVLEILIVVTTENHVYKFGNEYRVQAKGGPIGLRCTGEMADCCMIDWDKIIFKKPKSTQDSRMTSIFVQKVWKKAQNWLMINLLLLKKKEQLMRIGVMI